MVDEINGFGDDRTSLPIAPTSDGVQDAEVYTGNRHLASHATSRASALALSTVLRTTSLIRFPMGTCDFQATTEQNNPLTDRSEILHMQLIASARPLNLPEMVTIGWLGAASHTGGI
jgi:hypothetical protein